MNTKTAALAGLAALAILSIGAQSRAQDWPYVTPCTSGYVQEHIPYFAMHPPVYYSYYVARTYGYSPFAYPAGTPTPRFPVVISAASADSPAAVEGRPASAGPRAAQAPLRIVNPFVAGAEAAAPPGARKPQVVYPMAAFPEK